MNSSISSILNVARSAIFANQTGVRVASQNIANAQSDGYSRRTVSMVEAKPDITPIGRLGTGVRINDVSRVRDELLDHTYRQESSRASGYQLRHEVLGRVEEIFGEPSEDGLAATLDAFWASWSDLASRPSNPTARRMVQQRGAQVAATLQGFDRRLDEVRQHATIRLSETLDGINGIARQIGLLNREIVSSEGGGHEAHDLRDQRDLLLDKLSGFGNIRVLDRGRGSVAVMLENTTLVDGTQTNQVSASGTPLTLSVNNTALSFGTEGGTLGELVRTLNVDIPGVQSQLNGLASGLVAQVNALHNSGYTTGSAAGGDFFDDSTPVTASNIRLHTDIQSDPSLIVTSDTAGETTNNRIALAMAALQGRPSANSIAQGFPAWVAASASLSGRSVGEYYQDLVTENALQVSSAEHSVTVFKAITEQAEARRQSVSGVSTDEELVKLMGFQQAYTAATKVVTTVDEMLQAVLNMV